MSDNILMKTENLCHVYSQGTPFQRTAIDNVNIEIYDGEFLGVIGHTGSGKSTLIQHFNGLLKPTSGHIYFKGEDIWAKGYSLKNLRFNVGVVFQYPEHQLFEETVEKDISFGPINMGLDKDEIAERVRETIKIVGLKEDILEKSPFDLSGGQKRRVAIAGVMAMRPSVLILDEPTVGLDPYGRDQILDRIREYHAVTGGTVVFVSHRMEDIAKICQRVLVMNKSKVAMLDTTENIFARGEELVKMGLDIPQITSVFMKLRKEGYDVNDSVFTPEGAVEEILKVLKKDK